MIPHWLTLLIQRSVTLPVRMAESVPNLASVHVTQGGVAVSASKVCVIYPSHVHTDSGQIWVWKWWQTVLNPASKIETRVWDSHNVDWRQWRGPLHHCHSICIAPSTCNHQIIQWMNTRVLVWKRDRVGVAIYGSTIIVHLRPYKLWLI